MISLYDLPGQVFCFTTYLVIFVVAWRIWPAMAASWARISYRSNGSVTTEKVDLLLMFEDTYYK